MKSIVVAYDKNRAIGIDSRMRWGKDLPSDLRHFRDLTTGHSIIVGRKTFEHDFHGRGLPNRQTLVVSRGEVMGNDMMAVKSLSDAFAAASGEIFVVGGGALYELALPEMDTVYATEIDADLGKADTYFPELGNEWKEVAREHHDTDDRNKYPYDFVTYARS